MSWAAVLTQGMELSWAELGSVQFCPRIGLRSALGHKHRWRQIETDRQTRKQLCLYRLHIDRGEAAVIGNLLVKYWFSLLYYWFWVMDIVFVLPPFLKCQYQIWLWPHDLCLSLLLNHTQPPCDWLAIWEQWEQTGGRGGILLEGSTLLKGPDVDK